MSKRKEKRNKIKEYEAEVEKLRDMLKDLDVEDSKYDKITTEIGKIEKIISDAKASADKRGETWQKIGCGITTAACTCLGIGLAYRMDKNDDIMRNKGVFGWVNKIFKPN